MSTSKQDIKDIIRGTKGSTIYPKGCEEWQAEIYLENCNNDKQRALEEFWQHDEVPTWDGHPQPGAQPSTGSSKVEVPSLNKSSGMPISPCLPIAEVDLDHKSGQESGELRKVHFGYQS